MNIWLLVGIIFFGIISWMPAGALSERIFDFHILDISDNSSKKEYQDRSLGWIGLLLVLILFAIKGVVVLLIILVWSLYNLIVGIAKGGLPEWLKRQKEMSDKLCDGLSVSANKEKNKQL